jgi:hypothetical protein
MSHERDERTERVERKEVAGTPASAKLPGFAPRVPPIPARSDEEGGSLPFASAEELPAGNPPEKEKKMKNDFLSMIGELDDEQLAAVGLHRPKNKKKGDDGKPIDWAGFFEKWETLIAIIVAIMIYTFTVLNGRLGLVTTMIVVAVLMVPALRRNWKVIKKMAIVGVIFMAIIGVCTVVFLLVDDLAERKKMLWHAEAVVVVQPDNKTAQNKAAAAVVQQQVPVTAEVKKPNMADCLGYTVQGDQIKCCDTLPEKQRQACKDAALAEDH